MIIKDIDIYFIPETWVIPESLDIRGMQIKNEGLKIKFDSLNPGFGNFSRDFYQSWDSLGILLDNGETFCISIETENLFKVIQYSGILNNGVLDGTYKIIKIPGKARDVYKLIPEDSREHIVKSKVSKIYWDKNIKFTTKFIPGHLYASKKSRNLYLCVANDILDYSSKGYFIGIDSSPQSKVILLPIYPWNRVDKLLGKFSPKTFDDFFLNIYIKKVHYCVDYFKGYLGKDLGKVFDSGDFLEAFSVDHPEYIERIPWRILCSNQLWRNNQIVKEELIRRINKGSYSEYLFLDSSDFDRLKHELGI